MQAETLQLCKFCNEQRPLNWFRNRSNKCKKCVNEDRLNTDYYQRQKNGNRERDLMKRYGMTLEDYDNMLTSQGGSCAWCQKLPEDTPRGILFVDHCHETGEIRQLLCFRCNTVEGLLKDWPEAYEAIMSLGRSNVH